MKKFALFLLTVFIIPIIIAGCKSSISGGVTADIPVENNLEPIALFCQKDSCSKNLEFLLNFAKESINCAFYDLNLKNNGTIEVLMAGSAAIRNWREEEIFSQPIILGNKFIILSRRKSFLIYS